MTTFRVDEGDVVQTNFRMCNHVGSGTELVVSEVIDRASGIFKVELPEVCRPHDCRGVASREWSALEGDFVLVKKYVNQPLTPQEIANSKRLPSIEDVASFFGIKTSV